jgi:anti-anti-sigma factor
MSEEVITPVEIKVTETGQGTSLDPVIIEFIGRLDYSNKQLVEERMQELFDSGFMWFIVSLTQVDYLNSGGVQPLLFLRKLCESVGGEVVVAFDAANRKQVKDGQGPGGVLATMGFIDVNPKKRTLLRVVDYDEAKEFPAKQFAI